MLLLTLEYILKSGEVKPTNYKAYFETQGEEGDERFLIALAECDARQFESEFEWRNCTMIPKLVFFFAFQKIRDGKTW